MLKERKTFILDTSVLLYDKNSIHSFPESDLIIPIVVLDELDRFKDRTGILGENARYVNRFLDDLRGNGSLHEGVEISNNQRIMVELNHQGNVPSGLDPSSGDNKIISVSKGLCQEGKNVTVITKDINFRVKCDALGIKSEDYYKDKILSNENQIFRGFKEIEINDPDIINDFYENGKVSINRIEDEIFPNEFIIGKYNKKSFMGIRRNNQIVPVSQNTTDFIKINPRNKEQKFAIDLLTREDVSLVTLVGIAGSGKTFLTLMAALSGLNQGKYERIVFTRSLQPVGRDIGFLPGDLNEKMDPWIAPIIDNVRHAFKDVTYFNVMRDKGQIEIASYFTGAGGLDLGFEQASNDLIQFKTVFSTDIETYVEQTLFKNRPQWNFLRANIRELSPELVRKKIGKKPAIVIGGPPCQPFSVAGKQQATKDPLGTLYRNYVEHIRFLSPEMIVMENVYGLSQVKSANMIEEIYKSFEEIGYEITHRELMAADYGTPQKRRRLFFVAANDLHYFQFPQPTHNESDNLLNLPVYNGAGNSFRDLPPPIVRKTKT